MKKQEAAAIAARLAESSGAAERMSTSPHAQDSGYEPWVRAAVARSTDRPTAGAITYEMAAELLAKLDAARARVAELEPIEQRARTMTGVGSVAADAARYILTGGDDR